MRLSKSIRINRVIAVMALAVGATSALAYIPPAAYLLHVIAKKHVGFRSFKIKSRVLALVDGKPTGTQFISVSTYDPQSDTIEAYAQDEAGQRLFRAEKTPTLADHLLFDSSSHRMALDLKSAGIPLKVKLPNDPEAAAEPEQTRMVRGFGTVAWVVGDERKLQEPQLWVEKDTFLPLRLITTGEGGLLDLRFESFRSRHDFLFPQTIVLARKEGTPVLKSETIEVIANTSTPAKASGGAAGSGGFTEAGNSAPSTLKDLILEYFAAIR